MPSETKFKTSLRSPATKGTILARSSIYGKIIMLVKSELAEEQQKVNIILHAGFEQ